MLILTDRDRQFVDLPALPPLWVVACAFALLLRCWLISCGGIGRPIALSGFPARAPVQELIAGTLELPDFAQMYFCTPAATFCLQHSNGADD